MNVLVPLAAPTRNSAAAAPAPDVDRYVVVDDEKVNGASFSTAFVPSLTLTHVALPATTVTVSSVPCLAKSTLPPASFSTPVVAAVPMVIAVAAADTACAGAAVKVTATGVRRVVSDATAATSRRRRETGAEPGLDMLLLDSGHGRPLRASRRRYELDTPDNMAHRWGYAFGFPNAYPHRPAPAG